jgi:hypothetical protein
MGSSKIGRISQRYIGIITLAILFMLERWYLRWTGQSLLHTYQLISSDDENIPITVVVAAVKKDNLTLLEQESGLRPGDEQVIYIADDPTAKHTVPMNKGREAMVYLSFLIDRYDSLPELMVFMHAGRTAWHNNYLFDLKSATMVQRLRRSYVRKKGFVQLRCDQDASCRHVHEVTEAGYRATVLTSDVKGELSAQYAEFHQIWDVILPGRPIPPRLGTVSGSQFALTRETALKVPLKELTRLRQWMMDVDYSRWKTGSVFEYLWQVIFLGTSSSVLCPLPHDCYCSLYGVCLQSLSLEPEILMEEILETRKQFHRISSTLSRVRRLQSAPASSQRDEELTVISHGQIGPGLEGAFDYVRALEKNISDWTDPFEELVRKASLPSDNP